MIGLMKQDLHKTVEKTNLFWQELKEVLLNIEITLNNRPLNYLERDIKFPLFNNQDLSIRRGNIQLGRRHQHDRGGSAEKSEICQEVQG